MTLILAPCPCIYHEDEGGGEREVGRGLEPRLIGDDREASIISGSFLDLFFILPLIRIPEYSVPELVRGWGWRAFLPPPPPPPPLRNGGKRNDSLECLFSPM